MVMVENEPGATDGTLVGSSHPGTYYHTVHT